MYYDDFYDYPSEYEQMINEFKESILKAVKQEYQEEMERLRKENEELQEFKREKANILLSCKTVIENLEEEKANILLSCKTVIENLEKEKAKAKEEAKKARLSELLGDQLMEGWCPKEKRVDIPKCDLCDNNRHIEFTKPSGRKAKELCYVCGKMKFIAEPESVRLYRLHQRKYGYTDRYYELINNENEDDLFRGYRTPYGGEDFKDIEQLKVVFFKQDDCQKYCDWLNEKKE